jgi:AraC family transcriptional activator of pobA
MDFLPSGQIAFKDRFFCMTMNRSKYVERMLERDEIVKMMTMEHFASAFGVEARRMDRPLLIYTLIYIKQGNGHCSIDNRKVALQAGTVILVSPYNYLHAEHVLYTQGTVILFTEEFFCRSLQQEQLLYKAIFTPSYQQHFSLPEQEVSRQYFQSLVSMFVWEYRLGKDALLKFDQLHNMLLGIVLYLHKLQLEHIGTQLDLVEPYAKSQFVQFVQLLNAHFREESSLQFYADKMNVSLLQLTQICKKGIGWTPKAMMQEKLLREAKRLLMYDSMSVKEISYNLGFTEPTNFVKFFQQHTKISPKNFRIEHYAKSLSKEESTG